MASVRQIAIPVWVDIFQSTEDRNRTKGGGRENSVLFCLFELWYWTSPAIRLKLSSGPLVLRPLAWEWIIPQLTWVSSLWMADPGTSWLLKSCEPILHNILLSLSPSATSLTQAYSPSLLPPLLGLFLCRMVNNTSCNRSSVDPTERPWAGMVLQNWPKLRQKDWAIILLGSVYNFGWGDFLWRVQGQKKDFTVSASDLEWGPGCHTACPLL